MDQIFAHVSLQDLGIIVSIVTGIVGVLFQGNEVKNDARIVVNYIQHEQGMVSEHENNTGCATRAFFYFVLICATGLGISSLFTFLPQPPPPSHIEQAQAVIQNFYDDVNKKDYKSAYNMTTDGFSQNYEQFVAGYNFTKHSSISFEDSKELSDGTVQITIIIEATEQLPKEKQPTISYYRNMYVLISDHGGYIILKGIGVKIEKP